MKKSLLATALHRLDERGDGGEVRGVGGILAPRPVADALGKLEGVLAVWPRILVAGLLKQSEVFPQAVFDGVEVLEGSHHRVVPPLLSCHLAHAHELVGRRGLEVGGVVILVGLHHHDLTFPLAPLGDAEEVGSADDLLSPPRLQYRLCGDEGRVYLLVRFLGGGIYTLRKADLFSCCHKILK